VSEDFVSHEPFAGWAALAAVGALDGEERTRFEAHLAAGCGECEQRLDEFGAAAAALAWALPDAGVPTRLRDRVMARVAAERTRADRPPALRPGPRPAPRFWPRVTGLAAAGLVGLVAWGIYDTRSTLERQQASISRLERELRDQRAVTALVSGTDTSVAPLKGTGAAQRADGWVTWSPSRKRGFIVLHNLPPLPAGRQYQVWVVAGQTSAPAGVFDVDAIGHAALVVEIGVDRPERFAITVEPTGGQQTPSGPVVMQGGRAG
jgi:anti-sigma-K factor RskA